MDILYLLYYDYDSNLDNGWTLINNSKDNDYVIEGDIHLYLNPTDIDPFIVLYGLLYDPYIFNYTIHYIIIDNEIRITSNKHDISFDIIGEIKHNIFSIDIYPINIVGNITYNQCLYLFSLISLQYKNILA